MRRIFLFTVLILGGLTAGAQYVPPAMLLFDSSGNPYPSASGAALTYTPPSFTCYTTVLGPAQPCNFTGGGGGGVTTFSAGNLSPLFTTSVSNPTTTPALTFSLTTAGANTAFGNFTGSTAAPSYTATTGTGSPVSATSPTLVTPVLGAATATTINKVTLTAPATGSTLTIADGKTLTANNSITFAGTDATTMTFPSSSATIPGVGVTNTFSQPQSFTGAGAASTSQVLVNGTWFVAGSATTNYPALYVKASGASDGNLQTNGNGVVINAPSGFNGSGFLIEGQVNGGSALFSVNGSGVITSSAGYQSSTLVGIGTSGSHVVRMENVGSVEWTSTGAYTGTTDTTLCRASAGVVEVGSSTGCAANGGLNAGIIQSGATTFTVSGCGTAASVTGNGTVGSFTVGTGTTNCTFTVTINGATGLTASHGWIANADDTTANIHCVNSTTVSATTVVFVCTGTIATSDLIKFSAVPY